MDAPLSHDHEWHQANVGGGRDPMAVDAMNPGERALRARIGAYTMHGRNDARETTAKARAAFLARFERLADPRRGTLVGATARGGSAEEWISEVSLAVRAEVPVTTHADVVHPFPTYSEILEGPLWSLAAHLSG
jgi:hypothetical protein